MPSRAKFTLPPNWQNGTFAASIQDKQELLRRYTEEQKMLNAAKSLSSRQKRNHKSEGDEIRYV